MGMSKEIKELYDKRVKERDEILEKVKPLRKKAVEIMAKLEPIEKELRSTREKMAQIEKDGNFAEINRTLVAIGKTANPGRSLEAESGKFESKPS